MPCVALGKSGVVCEPSPKAWTTTELLPDALPEINRRSVTWLDSGPPALRSVPISTLAPGPAA